MRSRSIRKRRELSSVDSSDGDREGSSKHRERKGVAFEGSLTNPSSFDVSLGGCCLEVDLGEREMQSMNNGTDALTSRGWDKVFSRLGRLCKRLHSRQLMGGFYP
ncbi:uncharacterized protein G2W53_016313 [Senna tora]|uniref:Uncharacterized protein n=1 Tax=Senna tora TaxID=362788 RepID=A0A834TVS4_9FABA|nr:uncharacterized protein G2W53_016313 [Senna tora]